MPACHNRQENDNSMSNSSNSIESIVSSEEKGELGLKNSLKRLNLKGYVGNNLKNNIKYWQKDAYKNNKNIITQIKNANLSDDSFSLSSILGSDYFGVDSYYDIDIVEKQAQKYIGWKLKYIPNTFNDRDFRFSNDPNAICDWTGAKELWISIDNSEIDSVTSLRIAFEENHIGRESYSLVKGKKVTLYGDNKNEVEVRDNGYIDIPSKFLGYLSIPIDNNSFACYWSEGGNKTLEIDNVVQFQISVMGSTNSLNKTFYMKDFALVGDVGGTSLPNGLSSSDTYKIIWNINGLTKRNTSDSESSSLPWYGEFVGKLLTGIAFSYRAERNEDLVIAAEEIINDLKEAQGEDGYLGVFEGKGRYSLGASNWDLWNQYHCIVGLLEWYKNTGNEDALDIAKNALDCIYNTFKDRSYIVTGGFETNRGIAHGYALMYQITREDKYLKEAIKIIEKDCRDAGGWYNSALVGRSFYRSSCARWEVLHMIMTLGILYQETKNEEYYDVMSTIWYDILETDVHNDGGFTTNEGAVGDPYRDGVIETCCSIAWSAFTNEYLRICHEVEVADELERTYFNAILGSLLDDDKYCTYNTPVDGIQGTCGNYDGRRVKSQQDISFQFNSGSPDMNCCQANFARGIGQISEWATIIDKDAFYVNYYGNSNIEAIIDNEEISIEQLTSYPLNGEIKMTISGLKRPKQFNLKLRIPTWSEDSKVTYDGQEYNAKSGEYFSINKIWNNGDTINLKIGMNFTCWKGENSKTNKTSIYYGPILLAIDEYHLANSGMNIDFSKNINLSAEDFVNAKISNGNIGGAWIYVDVPYNSSFVRLVDFSSAGKYNGSSQPCSYYSWLNIQNVNEEDYDSVVDRWKMKLY